MRRGEMSMGIKLVIGLIIALAIAILSFQLFGGIRETIGMIWSGISGFFSGIGP